MERTAHNDVRVSILNPVALARDSMARVLKSEGLNVVSEFSEASQFLASLNVDPPNVAIVDLSSLQQDGFTVLHEAHQFHPETHLLVLLAGADPQTVDQCIQSGASGYLDKNSSGCTTMLDAIQALARGDRVFPALFLETFVRARTAPSQAPGLLQSLSARERQVLAHIANGTDNAKIAAALEISERTVKAHVSSLYRKLGRKNRTQLALLARQLGVRPTAEVVALLTGAPVPAV